MYKHCMKKNNNWYNISTVKNFSWLENMIKNISKIILIKKFKRKMFSNPVLAGSNVRTPK